ncbi:putative Pyrimidine 5'-nucleotidase YjjG [Seiridium cardinale]
MSITISLEIKKWIWFDLDDTLRGFRRASGAATSETLGLVARRHDLEPGDLERKYAEVLATRTSNAFVDGRTSREYRWERFSSVLSAFALPSDEIEQEVLDVYKEKLGESLRLKGSVLDVLKELRALGKKIAIVSEGPQDSQTGR